jgi:hypothetical protein
MILFNNLRFDKINDRLTFFVGNVQRTRVSSTSTISDWCDWSFSPTLQIDGINYPMYLILRLGGESFAFYHHKKENSKNFSINEYSLKNEFKSYLK